MITNWRSSCESRHVRRYIVSVITVKGWHMLEAHNGAVVASQLSRSRAAPRGGHAHMWWAILMAAIFVVAISAVVVTAVMGMTTQALIIAIFTGAFVSRCAC
jgi:fatty acid desaturase